jgi:hypothetical protein
MILKISFPKNLVTDSLLKQNNIPCLCKISVCVKVGFKVIFRNPLPEVSGEIFHLNIKEMELRIPVRVGGEYSYTYFGLITLKASDSEEEYFIESLKFFDESYGWLSIVENGEFAPPNTNLWEEDGSMNFPERIKQRIKPSKKMRQYISRHPEEREQLSKVYKI